MVGRFDTRRGISQVHLLVLAALLAVVLLLVQGDASALSGLR